MGSKNIIINPVANQNLNQRIHQDNHIGQITLEVFIKEKNIIV